MPNQTRQPNDGIPKPSFGIWLSTTNHHCWRLQPKQSPTITQPKIVWLDLVLMACHLVSCRLLMMESQTIINFGIQQFGIWFGCHLGLIPNDDIRLPNCYRWWNPKPSSTIFGMPFGFWLLLTRQQPFAKDGMLLVWLLVAPIPLTIVWFVPTMAHNWFGMRFPTIACFWFPSMVKVPNPHHLWFPTMGCHSRLWHPLTNGCCDCWPDNHNCWHAIAKEVITLFSNCECATH